MSTGFKILLATGLVALVAVVALADWMLENIRPHALQVVEESMVDSANQLAAIYAGHWEAGERAGIDAALAAAHRRRFAAQIYRLYKNRVDAGVYVTDGAGTVLFDSQHPERVGEDYSRWNDVYLALKGEYGVRATRELPDEPDTVVLHVAAPVVVDGRTVGVVTLYKPARSVAGIMDRARYRLVRSALRIVVVAGLLSLLAAWWIGRPLRRLTAWVRQVGEGRRVPPPRTVDPDLRKLGDAFARLVEALEGRRYAERFVQNLTHEMKSPLSAIAGAAELLEEDLDREHRERFLGHIRQATGRLRDLVDQLLDLAALENRRSLEHTEPVILAPLVDTVAEQLAPLLARRRLTLERDVPGDLAVPGDPRLLRRCLRNLVQNALEFSPDGGVVTVRARREGEVAVVTVHDEGPGIPGYALERVFERFYSLPRPGSDEKSSGLGLNFVREIVTLHGGEVTLENHPDGGAVATLRLPA